MSRSVEPLVSRARSGDVDAFEELVREYAPMVFRVAYRVVGNPHDAQDVAQRALLSAWQGLGTFRGDCAFSSWLHQIAHRHALNIVTSTSHIRWTGYVPDLVDPRRGPAQTVLERETATSVRAAVAALPPSQRAAVNLYHFEQLSYAQIATATRSSEPAVRSQLFRARRTLATALAPAY